jgi:DNA repair exonuclease SbcCD nuclease subunit
MLKYLVIGDLHFRERSYQTNDILARAIIDQAKNVKPDFIVILGDTLEDNEQANTHILKPTMVFLRTLSQISRVYLLMGNHDLINNDQFLSDVHSFTALKYWGENMVVVDTSIHSIIGGYTFFFVPFVKRGRFIEALYKYQMLDDNYQLIPRTLPDNEWMDAKCIFSHQEYKGANYGGIISVDGDEWDLSYPKVIAGHIHNYQEIQHNITYVGSPIQHSYGESPDKNIHLFIINDDGNTSHQKINLGLPRRKSIKVDCNSIDSVIIPNNCLLKIRFKGSTSELESIKKHPRFKEWEKMDYVFSFKNTGIIFSKSTDFSQTQKFSTTLYNKVKEFNELYIILVEINGEISTK